MKISWRTKTTLVAAKGRIKPSAFCDGCDGAMNAMVRWKSKIENRKSKISSGTQGPCQGESYNHGVMEPKAKSWLSPSGMMPYDRPRR
jgi:hypothetical protein